MFQTPIHRNSASSFFAMAAVTYHTIVRTARSGHRNAIISMVLDLVQGMVMIAAFLLFFMVLGLRSSPIRGDMILFVMSGVFVYMTHIKVVGTVMGAGGPTASMMLHRPMNTIIAIVAAALAALYKQTITVFVILSLYHMAINPITIHDPVAAMGFFLMAWFSGCAVGVVFLALKPWFPKFTTVVKTIYIRANMIASGKMFVVNSLPATMMALFDWNPLFHIIDQLRGAVFLHYNPQFTSVSYPIYVSLVLIFIGLMGEFFSRQHVSKSWSAGR